LTTWQGTIGEVSSVDDNEEQRRFVRSIQSRADRLGFEHLSAMQVVFALTMSAGIVSYDLEASVHRPLGLTWASYRVLVVLAASGPTDPSTTAQRAGMSRAAVSAVANTLERDGLITRRPSENDGRSVLLTLTNRGRHVFGQAKHGNNAREEVWCAVLDEDERAQLVALLSKLVDQPPDVEIRQRT
jgi:DNA-binding MarR family transcriptional regulator